MDVDPEELSGDWHRDPETGRFVAGKFKNGKTTEENQQAFLEKFSECGIVKRAARQVGIQPNTVYGWLKDDVAFATEFERARALVKDVVLEEMWRRGIEGWDEDVYQLAKFAGTVRKYDSTLLIMLAKYMMPEFWGPSSAPKVDVHVNITGAADSLRERLLAMAKRDEVEGTVTEVSEEDGTN